jgi:hypothetical protein
VIMLKDFSKKMSCPQNIRMHITKTW